jgi:hypothetical protein
VILLRASIVSGAYSEAKASLGWDRATQVDLGVHLDSCFRLPEIRPWEKSERKIDSGGIQRIDRVVQIDAEILARIKGPCLAHQALGDVAKSIPRCHLGKNHTDELLPALEMTNTLLCPISGDEPGKCLAFDEFDNLGEDVAAGIHRRGTSTENFFPGQRAVLDCLKHVGRIFVSIEDPSDDKETLDWLLGIALLAAVKSSKSADNESVEVDAPVLSVIGFQWITE